jgi:hypothetical protein
LRSGRRLVRWEVALEMEGKCFNCFRDGHVNSFLVQFLRGSRIFILLGEIQELNDECS